MKKITIYATILLLLAPVFPIEGEAAQQLVPVGQVIGLELQDDTVTVAGLDDSIPAAKMAGLQTGDQILKIDNRKMQNAQQVRQAVDRCDGSMTLTILRQGREKKIKLTPEITSVGPRLGVYLREGITGIGTVTWYDPATGSFGALGHAVGGHQGTPLVMRQGKAFSAGVMSVKKGKVGAPGQLMGAMDSSAVVGELYKNCPQGIFGKTQTAFAGKAIPIASQKEIKTGKAVIRSTVENKEIREYSVEILKVYPNSKAEGRNLLLKVTDPALLAVTGGIVQGMSGSPIIQDGKLVGAVTHVLVNDPTTGYGIFIENMLEAAS